MAKKCIHAFALIICIVILASCGSKPHTDNVTDAPTESETKLKSGNSFFDTLEGITRISASPLCSAKYIIEEKDAIERIVSYLKSVELEETDIDPEIEGGGYVVFYSGDEQVMSIGTDNDQHVNIDGKVYHRVSQEGGETLAGIFRSIWDDYGSK